MPIITRKVNGGVVYWARFKHLGADVWERVGSDKREAQRLLARRRREVKDGTYRRDTYGSGTTFGRFAEDWAKQRTTRNADDEWRALEMYVLPRAWLTKAPIDSLRPWHIAQLVRELKATTSAATNRLLSEKTVANIYGTVRTLIRDARIRDLLPNDPCVLPRGTFRRRNAKLREIYPPGEIVTLCTDERIPLPARVWNALAFYTGAREGEVCGLRWRDWDPGPQPLGLMRVERQYAGAPLKTERNAGEAPRFVPVHPVLAERLREWKEGGFELWFKRKPLPDDPIVPAREGSHHTRSSAYKMWLRSLESVGVENRSLHSSRHTFISLARRGGARKEVVERITHNAKGDIVDVYTHWDWAPLCEAVLCFLANSVPTPPSPLSTTEGGTQGGTLLDEPPVKHGGGAGNRRRFQIGTIARENKLCCRSDFAAV